MQWEIGEEDMEVIEVRKNKCKLETTCKASVEKDDSNGLLIVP
jgi:hypothetical protein